MLSDVFNDSTSKYDQTVYLNGKSVSTLSTTSGQAQGWGTAVECQAQACDGTAKAHSKFSIISSQISEVSATNTVKTCRVYPHHNHAECRGHHLRWNIGDK